jgi:intein-encoded DNA endonuclease-like protein
MKKLYFWNRKELPKSAYKLSPELAYILGVMLGDGYLAKYRLNLKVIDRDFALNFKEKLEKWSGLKTSKIKKVKTINKKYKCKDNYMVDFSSKKVVEIIEDYKSRIEKVMLNAPRKCQITFLEGLYDSEGSVKFYYFNHHIQTKGKIDLSNTNLKLLKLCETLLKKLNILPHICFANKKQIPNVYVLIVSQKMNIFRFHKLIHFSIKKKQERLNNLIASYKR